MNNPENLIALSKQTIWTFLRHKNLEKRLHTP